MKSIFLIIDSDFPSCENYQRCRNVWRQYMNLHPDIKCFFIRFDSNIEGEIIIKENTIFCKGEESYWPGILDKTLRAMKYCYDNFEFDFLVRTNLSSFWVFDAYQKHIENLPKEKVANAIIGNCEYGTFMSGCGFIISKDITELMIKNLIISDFPQFYDDVVIGMFLNKNNIKFSLGTRYDFTNNISLQDVVSTIQNLKNDFYHYRVKWDMGPHDAYVMQKLLEFHY